MKKMMVFRGIIFFLLFAALACSRPASLSDETIRVCVSESYETLLRKHVEEYRSLYQESSITLTGMLARESIVTFLNNNAEVIVVDRPMNPEELDYAKSAKISYNQLIIAHDALVCIVNSRNKLSSISLSDLRDILLKNNARWERFPESGLTGNIEFVITNINSGAYELLKKHFLNLNEELNASIQLTTQADVAAYISSHQSALGIISVAYLRAFSQALKHGVPDSLSAIIPLAIAVRDSLTQEMTPRSAHQANIYEESYPLHYPLYLYFKNIRPKLAPKFAAYLASAAGQRIILNAGIAPATMPARMIILTEE